MDDIDNDDNNNKAGDENTYTFKYTIMNTTSNNL